MAFSSAHSSSRTKTNEEMEVQRILDLATEKSGIIKSQKHAL